MKTEDQIELRKVALETALASGVSSNELIGFAQTILTFLQGTTSSADVADASAPIQSGSTKATGKTVAEADAKPVVDGKPVVDAGTGQPVAGNTEAAASDAGGSNDAAPATETFDGDVAKLQSKCTALAGRDGAAALLEAFNNVGAKKWSEVPEDKYAELWDHITAKGI